MIGEVEGDGLFILDRVDIRSNDSELIVCLICGDDGKIDSLLLFMIAKLNRTCIQTKVIACLLVISIIRVQCFRLITKINKYL